MLQSDDWGRVGVRDREGYEQLRARGLRLGEHPYDLYSLETADDVNSIASLLLRHRDSTGRHPCLVMNVCTANLDFRAMRAQDYGSIKLVPLAKGLPGHWTRPGLQDAYRAGAEQRVFFPALHGLCHFCPPAIEMALAKGGQRAQLLRLLWEHETPCIFWRMPWIGYEFWSPERSRDGFLAADVQRGLIHEALRNFSALFGRAPATACAPGFRANRDTYRAWSEAGIRVAESGTGSGLHPPHVDEFGMLHIYRSIDFEPSQREVELDKYLEIASLCFARGLPLVISVHSINFHSTLKDFRTPTLSALDALLTALESKHPELLYVHSQDLYEVVTSGAYRGCAAQVRVKVRREEWDSRLIPQGAL